MTILATTLITFDGGFYEGMDDDGECTARATLHDDGSITFADIDLGEPKPRLLQSVPEIKIGRDSFLSWPREIVIVSLLEVMLREARDVLLSMLDLPADREVELDDRVNRFIKAALRPATLNVKKARAA